MDLEQLFFELIRIAIGKQQKFTSLPNAEQWRELYQLSVQHTLAGVTFSAIECLAEEQRPPKDVLLQWYMVKEHIVKANRLLNRRAVETMSYFQKNGFDCCILKGQGIATLYPNPLLRTSGDIDVWLSGGRDRIYDFACDRIGVKDIVYKHIHYPLFDDVEVEVHPAPGVLCAPIEDYKLQSFFDVCAKEQFGHKIELPEGAGCIKAPTDEFNRLYLLLHIYCHLFYEGIGLRQVLDYYYVLRRPATMDSKARTVDMFRNLKMLRFARAMMWVQREVFGLEEEYLLVEPDEKEGCFLLSEIMQAGNFGKYDVRFGHRKHKKLIHHVWSTMKRNWKFLVRYPHEVVWDIPFRTWNFFWRRWKVWEFRRRLLGTEKASANRRMPEKPPSVIRHQKSREKREIIDSTEF